jgi:hypothetical protein
MYREVFLLNDDSLKNNFFNVLNAVNTNTEKTKKTFSLNITIYNYGKYFSRLLGIDHSTLLDKAVSEYIQNHKEDIPLNFNIEYSLPNISPELVTALETEAADLKRVFRQDINRLNRSLSKPTPFEIITKHRNALHKSVAASRRFLNSNKSFRDADFSNIFIEADEALEKASEKLERK